MGETQASHNWRGNETFSKPRPFRDEVIDRLKDEPCWDVIVSANDWQHHLDTVRRFSYCVGVGHRRARPVRDDRRHPARQAMHEDGCTDARSVRKARRWRWWSSIADGEHPMDSPCRLVDSCDICRRWCPMLLHDCWHPVWTPSFQDGGAVICSVRCGCGVRCEQAAYRKMSVM